MSFKDWFKLQLLEWIPLGNFYDSPKDYNNTDLGVRSKYITSDEAGVVKNKIKTADFGMKKRKIRKNNV